MKYKTILCPLDGTELMSMVEETAAYLSMTTGAKLLLVHVVEKWYRGGDVVSGSTEWKEIHEKWLKDGWAVLEKEAAALRAKGVKDVEILLKDGEAAYEIVAAAKEAGADIIVMATQHYTPIGKLFHGSVVDKVTRKSPCPILWIFKK